MVLLSRLTKAVVVAIPVSITLFHRIGSVVAVEGVSMQPVLNPVESSKEYDWVFLNRLSAHALEFHRGEVVSLVAPYNPRQNLIKRIVALEGDTVRTLDKQELVLVPAGHCWVEGDHHERSADSNSFGPISMGLLTGKATYIVWPPQRWGRLEVHPPDTSRIHRAKACLAQY